jgi:hypothetical protein
MAERFPIRGWYLISVLVVAAIVWAELTLPRARMPAVLPLAPLAAATHGVESYWYQLPDARRTQALYDWLIMLPMPGVILLFAALHALWSGAALRRGAAISRSSLIVVVVAALASVAWYVASWSYGIRYQGAEAVALYLTGSVLSLTALAGLAAWARRRPSLLLNLVFHTLSFVWLLILAFPYFGETP